VLTAEEELWREKTALGAIQIKDPEDGLKMAQDTFNAGDLDGLVGLYEAEAVFSLGPGQVATGSGAIREMLADLLATGGRVELKCGQNSLHQVGDLALRTLEWTIEDNDPGGNPLTLRSVAAVVLRRQTDGSWRVVIDNACPF
jgi:ketosteroid isomerase-like protein